jgi:hypothetical protein
MPPSSLSTQNPLAEGGLSGRRRQDEFLHETSAAAAAAAAAAFVDGNEGVVSAIA